MKIKLALQIKVFSGFDCFSSRRASQAQSGSAVFDQQSPLARADFSGHGLRGV
jgi:hypothetical protein